MIELTRAQFNKKMKLVELGVANDLRNAILDKVPVDTGRLKTSIKVVKKGKNFEIVMVYYGLYVEFGSVHKTQSKKGKKGKRWVIDPNPFIRSTVHTKLKDIVINNLKRHFT